ncbi:GAF domain-containing protein [Natrinema longum]|uniref:GAF domain-containing protein n=1 Tax=Natrinema longum TaxID=370324 RepID=A0A8A2UD16_9EURY|nr:GAF domain-containing protein [Natrinema longum]MBZ6495669.1 GAF domain-containing protein [Natrinema longum]QSW86372.1 GAF domain-containing protein [Natrinema longum]
MTHPPATTRPRTILYVAATEAAASDGATALETVETGPERSIRPATTVERVRNWAPAVDCVVFAETPTTAAGSNLLEVVEACGSTPLVLFSDPSYAPPAARSTDGIDGYVRRDTDDAVVHLADEIEWVCRGDDESSGSTDDGEATNDQPVDRLLESVPEAAACDDRDRLFDLLVETASDVLDRDYCWLSTVHFGDFTPRATASGLSADDLEPVAREGPLEEALRTGEPIRIDDLAADDRLAVPLEGVTSLCCLPVGDAGVLQVAAENAGAFDERDCDRLAAWCRFVAAILERIDAEASHSTEREQLRRERDQLRTERDRLADERDELALERDRIATENERLAAQNDRFQALFANVPEPAVRYEIDDGKPIVRDVNDTFVDVFGTAPETIVDEPVDEAIVPPGLESRRTTLLESLRAGECRQLVSRRETVDGVREFLLTLVPAEAGASGRNADGGNSDGEDNPAGLIVYSDVTDANRHERELAAAHHRLETIADLVDEDVRSPLNVARGYLELAAETGDEEHFRAVEDAQEQLRELVDQLVAIARQDDVIVETEPVAIHDVARRAWVAVETGDARLVTQTTTDRVLEADKARLRELFEHVLGTVVDSAGTAAPEADDGAQDGEGERTDPATQVVTVGATDDGFYVARHNPDADRRVVDEGLETDPVPGRLAAGDGTGFELGTVERIADAHGWNVGVAEDDDRIAFAFRGVESVDET